MQFKIALIGCGWVSNFCHGPAYQEYAASHEDVVLAACCDSDPQRAADFQNRFGFQRAYTNYLDMLDNEHPNAVCLNVPPPLVARMGVEIMQRGYPLMAEKPPGLTVADIDHLIAAADRSQVIHQVAFNRRYMPLITELRGRLPSTIHHIDGRMTRIHRTDAMFATTAVHMIDAAKFLIGCDYEQINFYYQELPEEGPGVANCRMEGHYTNGTSCHLSFYPLAGADVEAFTLYSLDRTDLLEAFNRSDSPGHLRLLEKGILTAEIDVYRLTQRREPFYINGFYHEAAAFFDAVQAGTSLPHDFASCRQSIEIMQCLLDRKNRYEIERE